MKQDQLATTREPSFRGGTTSAFDDGYLILTDIVEVASLFCTEDAYLCAVMEVRHKYASSTLVQGLRLEWGGAAFVYGARASGTGRVFCPWK